MEQKTIILCPNPDRDRGMKATTTAIQLLQSVGFKTVVCSPFRDPKAGAFGNLPVKPILPEPHHHTGRRRNDFASCKAGGAAQAADAGNQHGRIGLPCGA